MTPALAPDHQNGFHGALREIPNSMDFAVLKPPAAEIASECAPAGLAEVLSPSQVNTWFTCGFRWWAKYGLQLPQVQGGNLALGKAFHAAIGANFRDKLETKKDLRTEGVIAIYKDEWAKQEEITEFDASEDKNELKECGGALVRKYMDEQAWKIQPKAVDLAVEGVIAGVPVRGFVDLLDADGRIIDLKTANKSPSKDVRPDYRMQVTSYARITPGACGHARLETVVRLKRDIKVTVQSFEITDADDRMIDTLYPLAQAGMRAGLYAPNRSSLLCARRYCSYWRECEREFGGQVKGGEE